MDSIPFGEYMLRWIGTGEICLVFPVIRSVSSEISLRTTAVKKVIMNTHILSNQNQILIGKTADTRARGHTYMSLHMHTQIKREKEERKNELI